MQTKKYIFFKFKQNFNIELTKLCMFYPVFQRLLSLIPLFHPIHIPNYYFSSWIHMKLIMNYKIVGWTILTSFHIRWDNVPWTHSIYPSNNAMYQDGYCFQVVLIRCGLDLIRWNIVFKKNISCNASFISSFGDIGMFLNLRVFKSYEIFFEAENIKIEFQSSDKRNINILCHFSYLGSDSDIAFAETCRNP